MSPDGPASRQGARRIRLSGHVQGVGFRPFVYRLAQRHGIRGWVKNCVGEVEILAEGGEAALESFQRALTEEAPPLARPCLDAVERAAPSGCSSFEIAASDAEAEARIHVPPDYFTCDDCVGELLEPADRRYGYPFINCTQCGPRYTLIAALPYDRPNTSMAQFELCPACRREYEDPLDRRFHAEPVACEACGPRLRFTREGRTTRGNERSLAMCHETLAAGGIVAVKGVGGFHLVCSARQAEAIRRLRARKPRPDKPLALMLPDPRYGDVDWVRELVELTRAERDLLVSPVRPIVLARLRTGSAWAREFGPLVAPGLAEIGVMLPYSPLHHLLLTRLAEPVVATSANISGEPVLTRSGEVESRLGHIADAFLHHDRPILRPADDPVCRTLAGRPRPLRLGRGTAPLELGLRRRLRQPTLAVGGHMKNVIGLGWEDRLVLSPHIGDMGTARSLEVFETVIEDLQRLYGVRARHVVCDAHPGYVTTRWARSCGLPRTEVLHHHAHASLAVRGLPPDREAIAFTWDGVGLGGDGTLWGGEAFLGAPGRWRHAATMRPFRLPGGDAAGREPWRSAAALCWETGRAWDAAPPGGDLARLAWDRGLNAPTTSAVGRLFDAAAALIGLVRVGSYEGQGPMQLEAIAVEVDDALPLPLSEDSRGRLVADWGPLIDPLVDGTRPQPERAGLFQASMAQTLLDQALALRERHGTDVVGLGGGCFQNRFLTTRATALLTAAGFEVVLDAEVPLNDGGLAAGQLLEIAARPGPATPPAKTDTDRS